MLARCFPPPWSVEDFDACFVVWDSMETPSKFSHQLGRGRQSNATVAT
jgi:hypothetical protein